MFAPPDFVEIENEARDLGTYVRVFEGKRHTLALEVAPLVSQTGRTGDLDERILVDGHYARVAHMGAALRAGRMQRFTWRVVFEEHWAPPSLGPAEVSLTVSCVDDAACEPWQAILRGARFMTQPVGSGKP